MDGAAVKELAARFREPKEIGGFIVRPNDWSADDPTALVKAGPSAESLKVYSLGAIRDYIKANRDALPLASLVVHVVSPQVVRVLGPIQSRARNREGFIEATAHNLTDGFLGKFTAIEEFIVGLQTRFALSDDRTQVLRLLSNVKHETVKTSQDDGMTQVVQAKAGVVLQQEVPVPNPVTLTPYRTFREVTQPSSLFVLRVNSGRAGGLPEVGLFEADGGAWRLLAVEAIRDWLLHELADTVAVLA